MNLLQDIKKLLKRSGFLSGMVRAMRAALLDVKKIYGWVTRTPKIISYLQNNQLNKLQLRTSNTLMAGWLNTHLIPTSRKVVYLDATRPFPFRDDIFDYV